MLELTEYSNGIDDSLRVYNVLVTVSCRLFCISALPSRATKITF